MRQRGRPATSERPSYRPFDDSVPWWPRVVWVYHVCSVCRMCRARIRTYAVVYALLPGFFATTRKHVRRQENSVKIESDKKKATYLVIFLPERGTYTVTVSGISVSPSWFSFDVPQTDGNSTGIPLFASFEKRHRIFSQNKVFTLTEVIN